MFDSKTGIKAETKMSRSEVKIFEHQSATTPHTPGCELCILKETVIYLCIPLSEVTEDVCTDYHMFGSYS